MPELSVSTYHPTSYIRIINNHYESLGLKQGDVLLIADYAQPDDNDLVVLKLNGLLYLRRATNNNGTIAFNDLLNRLAPVEMHQLPNTTYMGKAVVLRRNLTLA